MRSLPDNIPHIRRFVLGENAGIDHGTYDMVIAADFGSADDYEAYRDHPYHRTLIETVTGPHHRRPDSGPALDDLTDLDGPGTSCPIPASS